MRHPTAAAFIEALETRIAPASIVTVTFTDGALTLTGDAGSHDFAISQIDGSAFVLKAATGTTFQVTGMADTDTLQLAGPIKTLSVTLGDDTDHLSLAGLSIGGDVNIAGGAGANAIELNTLMIKGGFKVTGGAGTDQVITLGGNTSVKKDFVLDLGDATNSFTLTGASLVVSGAMSYTGGSGADTVTIGGGLLVKKDFTLTTGAGDFTLASAQIGNVNIAGTLRLDSTGSLAGNRVAVQTVSYIGNLQGSIDVKDGAGDLQFQLPSLSGLTTKGTISVVTGPGASSISLGALYFAYGLGFSSAAKSITIDASASSSSSFGLGIGKSLQGKVTYRGGSGSDEVQIYSGAASTSLGPLIDVDLGNGDNEFTAVSFGGAFKDIIVKGGSGKDEVGVALVNGKGSNIDIQNGGGIATTQVALVNAKLSGKLSVRNDTGAGASVFQVGGVNSSIGSIDFESGATSNAISLGAVATLGASSTSGFKYLKGIKVVTAGGDDTVDFSGIANLTAGYIDLELGDGTNATTGAVTNVVTKSLTITGGAGADTVDLSGSGNLGKATVTSGAGANAVSFGGTVLPLALSSLTYTSTSGAGEADSLTLARVLLAGNLDAKFGADASTVQVDDSVVGGTFVIDTGAGMDVVKLDTATTNLGTTLVKAATINLGGDNDTLTLGGNGTTALLTAKSTFTADGQGGSNTLTNAMTNVFAKDPVFLNFS